ncbi:hypothetical protein [Klebsiella variicola]|uniref:hypothetical protein n=1 Tax=Klebsiella variicola TaxID=244366 RepID=UPI002B05D7BD|nr:hypothetical protein [Klebsiella variicola]
MNFEPENYSRRALLWFAAVIEIAGWVAVFVVTWGICMVIEWVWITNSFMLGMVHSLRGSTPAAFAAGKRSTAATAVGI